MSPLTRRLVSSHRRRPNRTDRVTWEPRFDIVFFGRFWQKGRLSSLLLSEPIQGPKKTRCRSVVGTLGLPFKRPLGIRFYRCRPSEVLNLVRFASKKTSHRICVNSNFDDMACIIIFFSNLPPICITRLYFESI